MADETLTVLLRIDASTKAAQAELAKLRGEQDRAGDSATKMADKQDSAFQKAKKSFTEFNSALSLGKQVFGFLSDSADAFAKKNTDAGKAWTSASKEWDDSLRKVKEGIGQIVVNMAPLISALSKAIGLAADLLVTITGSVGATQQQWLKNAIRAKIAEDNAPFRKALNDLLARNLNNQIVADFKIERLDPSEFEPPQKPRTGGGSGGGYSAGERTDLGAWEYQTRGLSGFGPVSGMSQSDLDARFAERSADYKSRQGDEWKAGFDDLFSGFNNLQTQLEGRDFVKEQQQSYLESILGPVGQFDVYAEGFNLLSGAAQGAFDTWVDGSMSAGDAMKKFFSDAIKGAASQMFAEAIKHGAWAIGDLAFGNLPGAAMHAKAAAAFGAGALAVGGIARQMGGGGGGSSGGGGGGGGYGANLGGGGSGGGANGSNITVLIGDYFAADNPRARQGEVARAIRGARRELDDGGGVSFS